MKMTLETYHALRGSYAGFCTHCKDITRDWGVEPDAEKYICPECDHHTVKGMEYAMMGEDVMVVDDATGEVLNG